MPKKRTSGKSFADVMASLEGGEGSDPGSGQLPKDELDTSGSGSYRAFDFRSGDGRVLLYVEEFC